MFQELAGEPKKWSLKYCWKTEYKPPANVWKDSVRQCCWLSRVCHWCFFPDPFCPQETAIWLCGPLGARASWPAWRGEALRPRGAKLARELSSFRSWRTRAAAHIKSLRPSPVKVPRNHLVTNVRKHHFVSSDVRDLNITWFERLTWSKY